MDIVFCKRWATTVYDDALEASATALIQFPSVGPSRAANHPLYKSDQPGWIADLRLPICQTMGCSFI
jgi:hypothetical protein